MQHAPAALFVHALVRHGALLLDLIDGLAEELERTGAYPGEDPAAVVLDMTAGSVAVRLPRVPPEDFERAVELMELAFDAVLDELRITAEVARRRGNGHRASAA